MKMPSDRPKGKPSPKTSCLTPNGPERAKKQSKVGVMGKDDDGARKHYHRGLLSGKKR